jgi:hypothetical protein
VSELWTAPLRVRLECLYSRRCLCGSATFADDVMERGDSIPEYGIHECFQCGAIWDFGTDGPPDLIRKPTPDEQPD